jgi:hypothetical protein
MRKIDAASVKADFATLARDLLSFHTRVETSLDTKRDISTLAETTALRLAVIWEGFVSDLFVAYINRDCSTYAAHLQRAFEGEFSGKQKEIFQQFGALSFPAHMDRATVLALVDRQEQNITFRNAQEMRDRARQWLIAADQARFQALNGRDRASIDLLVSIRNHLAHGSKGSLDRMNAALAAPALQPTGLQRGGNGVYNVGSYLKAVHLGQTRLIRIFNEMTRIAAAL